MSEQVQVADAFESAANDVSYVKWLPYLDLRQPHPLAGIESEDITDAKEIYEYFKQENPKAPFNEFLSFINMLPAIPGINEKKVKQVLSAVRLRALAKKGKFYA